MLAFLAMHLLCNLMMLFQDFQDLEYLNDFQTIGYGGHFVFQNEAKIFHRHAL